MSGIHFGMWRMLSNKTSFKYQYMYNVDNSQFTGAIVLVKTADQAVPWFITKNRETEPMLQSRNHVPALSSNFFEYYY